MSIQFSGQYIIRTSLPIDPRLDDIEVAGKGWYAEVSGHQGKTDVFIHDYLEDVPLEERTTMIIEEILPALNQWVEHRIKFLPEEPKALLTKFLSNNLLSHFKDALLNAIQDGQIIFNNQ